MTIQKALKNLLSQGSTFLRWVFLCLSVFLLNGYTASGVTVKYVTVNGAGLKDGTSWANAYLGDSLQYAINTSTSGNQVWVAAGTYLPAKDVNGTVPAAYRNRTFALKSGVEVYGGFAGTETATSQRNVTTNITYLDGTYNFGNVYHVVSAISSSAATIMDGFTVQNGQYSLGSPGGGGGMINTTSNATVSNCIFQLNKSIAQAGAVYNSAGSPKFISCTFSSNETDLSSTSNVGGAVYNFGSAASFSKCVFNNNKSKIGGAIAGIGSAVTATFSQCTFYNNSSISGGAAIYLVSNGKANLASCIFNNNQSFDGSSLGTGGALQISSSGGTFTVSNCAFSNNKALGTADDGGGSIMLYGGTATLTNCTIYGCTSSTNGGAVSLKNSPTLTVSNCIFWGNTSPFNNPIANISGTAVIGITYSDIEGGYAGTGNLNLNPKFVNSSDVDGADNTWATADDGLRLLPWSPALDNGTSNALTTDLLGITRNLGFGIDMGAYEHNLSFNTVHGASSSKLANYEYADNSNWTNYYQWSGYNSVASTNDTSFILLSIFKNGNTIGTVGDGTFKAESFTTGNYGSNTGTSITHTNAPYITDYWYTMNSYWKVTPTTQLPDGASGVLVKDYYSKQDSSDLDGNVVTPFSTSDIIFYKVNDGAGIYDPNPASGHMGIPLAGSCSADGVIAYVKDVSPSCSTWVSGTYKGVDYGEYEVQKFSGGGAGMLPGSILPVRLISFTGEKQSNKNILRWTKGDEGEVKTYELERSADGGSFSLLKAVANSSLKQYTVTDELPLEKNNFYRIKIIGKGGKYQYSNIVLISNRVSATITAYPNPAIDKLFINLPAGMPRNGVLVYTDMAGRTVKRKTFSANAGSTTVQDDISELPKGYYLLTISGNDLAPVKVMKQ